MCLATDDQYFQRLFQIAKTGECLLVPCNAMGLVNACREESLG